MLYHVIIHVAVLCYIDDQAVTVRAYLNVYITVLKKTSQWLPQPAEVPGVPASTVLAVNCSVESTLAKKVLLTLQSLLWNCFPWTWWNIRIFAQICPCEIISLYSIQLQNYLQSPANLRWSWPTYIYVNIAFVLCSFFFLHCHNSLTKRHTQIFYTPKHFLITRDISFHT